MNHVEGTPTRGKQAKSGDLILYSTPAKFSFSFLLSTESIL